MVIKGRLKRIRLNGMSERGIKGVRMISYLIA
jgi:hypothetical protein